jgi:hypothetical protein
LYQSYERETLSSLYMNSILPKNNAHSFRDKAKPVSGKEQEKNDPTHFQRTLSCPLIFQSPRKGKERNPVKPMRWRV